MESFISWLGLVLPTFLLVLARTMGLFLQAPVLSNRNIPAPFKMSLMVSMSIIVMTLLPSFPTVPSQLLAFLILALTEYAVGALFGFAANFMFLALQSAGELSGVQAGMSFASTMNPLLRSSVNPIGTLYNYIGTTLFLVIGGHRFLIGAFYQSFELLPIGHFYLTPALATHFIQISATFLAITLQIALPAVIVVFMADLGVGYINKVAQQASNITELVQAVKPIAGLGLVLLVIPNIMSMTSTLTEQMITNLKGFLLIAGGH